MIFSSRKIKVAVFLYLHFLVINISMVGRKHSGRWIDLQNKTNKKKEPFHQFQYFQTIGMLCDGTSR